MNRHRRVAASAAALTLTLTLAACGAGDETPDTSATPEATADAVTANDADVEFAQMMVIHHEGAIEMADLAAAQGSSEDVRALGERISAAQGPEIETMTGWLAAWGEDMPAEADMGGMDHGGMDMGGLDQDEAMEELRGLSGAEFDRRFLELMIEHHRGAVVMAEAQRGEGENLDAISLAGKIIDDQQIEITEMERMLRGE